MTGARPERPRPGRRRAERAGRLAETAACWWLRLHGYRILARRQRTPLGEIDIIARRGAATVFVEVKARASHDSALASVSPRQARRMLAAARCWLAGPAGAGAQDCRFDIITVSPYQWPRHVPNAFGENDLA